LAFERFLEDGSPHWAEALADGAGVGEACRRRGLSGLLMRRPVQLCVDAQMSFVFSQVVPLGGGNQTREADRGDGYDLWHAVLASVADVFITGDGDLEKNLGRVPIGGLRVVTSPRALLDGL